MRRLVRGGAEVYSGWSVSNPIRESESRAVMEMVGVPQKNLVFHSLPDGKLCSHLEELVQKWEKVVREVAPHRIVVGAFECGHLDHDSTNFAVNQARESLGKTSLPIFEVPFYHTYLTRIPVINRFADDEGEEIIALTEEEQKIKIRASRMYRSQRIGLYLTGYTLLKTLSLRPVRLYATERMRLQTHDNFFEPNLPAELAEKVKRSEKWKQWLEAMKRYAEKHSRVGSF